MRLEPRQASGRCVDAEQCYGELERASGHLRSLAGCQLRHHCNPEYAAERSTRISGDAGPNAGQFSMMSTFVQVLEHIEQNAGQFSMMSTFVLKHIEQHVESTKHAFQYKTCTLAPS